MGWFKKMFLTVSWVLLQHVDGYIVSTQLASISVEARVRPSAQQKAETIQVSGPGRMCRLVSNQCQVACEMACLLKESVRMFRSLRQLAVDGEGPVPALKLRPAQSGTIVACSHFTVTTAATPPPPWLPCPSVVPGPGERAPRCRPPLCGSCRSFRPVLRGDVRLVARCRKARRRGLLRCHGLGPRDSAGKDEDDNLPGMR